MRYVEMNGIPRISKIGLGTSQFGSATWGYGESYSGRRAREIVRRALDLGVTLFDTAEIYACGRSERILAEGLAADRRSVVVTTKLFPVLPSARLERRQATASLARLGIERFALYQVHWPNPLVPEFVTMRALRRMRRAGLVAEVGVSKYTLRRWRSAERSLGGRVLTNQVEYNLLDRSAEHDLLPFARANGRIIIAFSPLRSGLLAGRYDATNRPAGGFRATSPLFRSENLARITPLLDLLRDIGTAHAASPAQVALAWTIRDPAVVAIPGASDVGQVESNAAAAELALTDDESRALDRESDKVCARARTRSGRERLRSDLRQLSYSKYVVKALLDDRRLRTA